MAEVDSSKPPSLSEQYLLQDKEQAPEMAEKSVDAEVEPSVDAAAEETVQKIEETNNSDVGQSKESSPADESNDHGNLAPAEENNTAESENSEEAEETPEIKLETAPADFRFPTTNQSRHCFTRYIEYHRCVAAKGEGASECDKFAKYYRSLCPGEWIDRWNEQRENGTFPGPL